MDKKSILNNVDEAARKSLEYVEVQWRQFSLIFLISYLLYVIGNWVPLVLPELDYVLSLLTYLGLLGIFVSLGLYAFRISGKKEVYFLNSLFVFLGMFSLIGYLVVWVTRRSRFMEAENHLKLKAHMQNSGVVVSEDNGK